MSGYFDRREELRRIVDAGQCWVSHSFYLGSNLPGATAVASHLTQMGFQYAQTDSTDEEHWHVLAWGWTDTDGAVAASVEEEMRALAQRSGGEYQGWTLVRNSDGSLPAGTEPLF